MDRHDDLVVALTPLTNVLDRLGVDDLLEQALMEARGHR